MAIAESHLELARQLVADMRNANAEDEWPIVVDAGYYALFHTIEAVNAIECRNTSTFADFADILENVLTGRILDRSLLDAYNYLFYFRRGATYGCHVPSAQQIAEYAGIVESGIAHVLAKIDAAKTHDFFPARASAGL